MHHVGSAHTEETLDDLVLQAEEWIKDYSSLLFVFPDENPNKLLHLNHCIFLGVQYNFFNDQMIILQDKIGLGKLPSLLKDLITVKIFAPASKLHSLELLEQYFGIRHNRKAYYKLAPRWIGLKDNVERAVMDYAKKCYSFNYELVFYDVTTLYFQTFEDDELRKNGFSKDNKSQQPQILVPLLVTKEGFPVAYEIFSGNTFEEHTIIPMVKGFIEKNKVENFTVLADAAMISMDNIKELTKNNINYIVGGRLGSISEELPKTIDKNICR